MTKIMVSGIAMLTVGSVFSSTTIVPAHKDAFGANIGWINAQGDVANGMVVG